MRMLRIAFDDLDWDADRGAIWQREPFTGITYEAHPDGQVLGEYHYVNGIQTGLSQDWYPSGRLKREAMYRYGSLFGPYREWYENGQLKQEAEYELSIPLRSRWWDEAGQITREYTLDESSRDFAHLQLLRSFRYE